MSDCFLVYFIKRVNTLRNMAKDIDFIVTNDRTLRALDMMPPGWTHIAFLRGIPVALVDPNPPADPARFFLVKRKDTGKCEPWLEDYDLEPAPDMELMIFFNDLRRNRARGERMLRGEEP